MVIRCQLGQAELLLWAGMALDARRWLWRGLPERSNWTGLCST